MRFYFPIIFFLLTITGTVLGQKASENDDSAANSAMNIAAALQNSNDYPGAITKWTDFIDKYPQDKRLFDAKYNRAVCYYLQDNFESAQKDLDAILDTRSDSFTQRENALFYSGLTNARLTNISPERLQQAQDRFETLLKEFPRTANYPTASYRLAEIYYQQAKYNQAITSYQQVYTRFPKTEEAVQSYIKIGRIMFEQGRIAQCARFMSEFNARWPQHPLLPEAACVYANALFEQKLYQQAEKQYDLASNAKTQGINDFSDADYALIRRADCWGVLNDPKQAANICAELVSRFPKSNYSEEATLRAGQYYLKSDNIDAAQQFLESAAKNPKTAPDANLGLTQLAFQKDDIPAAIRYIQLVPESSFQCPADSPDSEQAAVRAACLLRAKIFSKSPEKSRQSIELCDAIVDKWGNTPTAPWTLFFSANTCFQIKDYFDCMERCQKLQKLYPQSDQARESLILIANCLLLTNQYEQAAPAFLDLFKQNPTHPNRYQWLIYAARSYDYIKNYQQVWTILASEFKNMPSPELKAEALFLSGKSAYELKRFANAEKILNYCKTSYPQFDKMDLLQYQLGLTYLQINQPDQAKEMFESVLKNFPDSSIINAAQYQLSQMDIKSGNLQKSLESAEKLIALPKDNPFRARAIMDSAFLLFTSNLFDQAKQRCDLFITDYPQSSDVIETYYIRSQCKSRLDDKNGALEDILQSLELATQKSLLDKWQVKLLTVQAACYSQTNNYDKTIEVLRTLFAIRNKTNKKLVDEDSLAFMFANALAKTDNLSKAQPWYNYVYEKFPQSRYRAACTWQLGCFAVDKNEIEQAKNYFSEAASGTDLSAGVKSRDKLGWIYFTENKFDKAYEQFDTLLTDVASNDNKIPLEQAASEAVADARFMRAQCRFNQKKYDQALELYQNLTDVIPENQVAVALHAAQSAIALGQFPVAQTLLDRVLDDNNQFKESVVQQSRNLLPAVQFEAALILFNTNKLDQAQKQFEAITQQAEKSKLKQLPDAAVQAIAKSWFYQGELEFQKKRYREAIRLYYNVIYGYSLPDIQADACYEAARCFEALSQFKQAQKQYKQIIEKFPHSSKADIARKKIE